MPLTRSQSQSASSSQPVHLFSGFSHWRRRRTSTSVPNSPLASSSTTTAELSHTSSQSEPLYHDPTCSSQDNLHIRLIPNIGSMSKCFVFDIIDRVLTPTTVLTIGRHSERLSTSSRISFKSKVVSRSHAEIWMEEGKKIFIRDIGSSSGTFVNRSRLSESNEISSSMELKDGDTIQLGVDYQGGLEQVYKSVKIRLEINRDLNKSSSYSRQAFQQLRQHLLQTNDSDYHPIDGSTLKRHDSLIPTTTTIQECCICLYAIAPLQALFVAPCSHVFHFKCLRPILLQHYPGFSCPLCRNYHDLEASVAIEVGEVTDVMKPLSFTSTDDQKNATHQIEEQTCQPIDGPIFSNTLVDSSILDQDSRSIPSTV